MNHAVDVIADKIAEQLGTDDCVVRGGNKDYLKKLRHYLKQLLHGLYEKSENGSSNSKSVSQKIKQLHKQISKIEKNYVKTINKEKMWGNFLYKYESSLINKSFFNTFRYKRIKNNGEVVKLLMDQTQTLEQLLNLRNDQIIKLIKLKKSDPH